MAAMALYTASATALGLYLNAKTQLIEDLRVYNTNRNYSKRMAADERKGELSLFKVLKHNYKTIPSAPSIFDAETSHQETWRNTYLSVVRLAAFARLKNVQPGDVVVVFCTNKPILLHIWLAMAAIGAAPAFINYNLSGQPLLHCIKVSGARLILADESVSAQLTEHNDVMSKLGLEVVELDEVFRRQIEEMPIQEPTFDPSKNKPTDLSCIFYTSGTTGFPKPAAFALFRWYGVSFVIGGYLRMKSSDRFYTCMPLYHGSGSSCFIMCLFTGACFCLGKKFSVSRFWDDVRASRATIINYVGETCRYLLNAPASSRDREHHVHTAYGNGLRPDVWEAFRDRFGVRNILEFYGSSEGMGSTLNYNSGPCGVGAVGRDGLLQRFLKRDSLVAIQIDPGTMEPRRSPLGLCVRVEGEDSGELLMKIPSMDWFAGYYRNPEDTMKKVLRNVLEHGDMWFRSGDLLRFTNEGYWFFVDRLGDTFRWKSENVSTMEVAEALSKFPDVVEVIVYGVSVPKHEGKAGCAALVLQENLNLDFAKFAAFSIESLPKYAVPLFLRVIRGTYRTENNKQMKAPLVRDGIDPGKIPESDSLYRLTLQSSGPTYTSYTEADWADLQSGKLSL